jgi:hypothetical protein
MSDIRKLQEGLNRFLNEGNEVSTSEYFIIQSADKRNSKPNWSYSGGPKYKSETEVRDALKKAQNNPSDKDKLTLYRACKVIIKSTLVPL